MAKVDLRKLKDQATKAIEKKQYAKAAELYLQIAAGEPSDPDWRQRAGEALRKVPDGPRAAEQLTLAAEGYAKGGFLLKAIAVCKVVLQIDPRHTATQAMLAELYARREGHAPAGSVAMVAQVDLARTSSGEFQIVPKQAAPGVTPPHVPVVPNAPRPSRPPMPQVAFTPSPPVVAPPPIAVAPPPPRPAPTTAPPPTREPLGLDSASDALVAIDERPLAVLPATAPLEALPLHALLGGQRSGQFALADAPPDEPQPSAYEIELGEDDLSLAEAIPIELPIPVIEVPPAPAARDEMDFSDVLDEEPPPPGLAPLPHAPAPSLPRIPLFSSLAADELRQLIERVAVRDFEPGQPIMRQGESGQSLFVVVHGNVDVALAGPPPRMLATLGEGAFFGELGLLTNFPRSATVTAREPTQLLEISRELVLDIVARSPDVLKTLLRFFRDRLLDRLLGESALFASLPPEEARRLAERFLFLELEPGMRVVVQGERSPGLFVLLCGDIDVVRAGMTLAQIAPGDVFGEISLLDRKPATASIVTRTKSWALELPRADFQEIMLTYPQLLSYVSELAERRKQSHGSEERVEFL